MKLITRSLAGFLSALVVVLAITAVFHLTSWGKDAGPTIKVDTTALDRNPQLGNSYAPVVKKASPSVVNIYTTRVVHMRLRHNPFFDDPFFRQFFGNPPGGNDNREVTRREQFLGSGVIISPDGYIMTANHVVEGMDEIKVAIGDSDADLKYTAKVVGSDPPTDVAVLKINAKDLPAITLGDSSQLEVGDVVLAIGNPFGMGQSVTMGIISGLGRHYKEMSGYQNFIQTDAAINQGNSGGALVDASGRLIGINTWIASSSGGSEGVGFAVPINLAQHVMERLISSGKVTRGYLGIIPQDITPDLAGEFNLPVQNGALVSDVETNTPAQQAGIKSGDAIVEINGKKVPDANSLRLMVSDLAPGTKVAVKFIHDGHEKTVTVALAELPISTNQAGNDQNGGSGSGNPRTDALDGVTVADLDKQVRGQLNIPDYIQGVVVTDVDQDSNADEAGLRPNDVIVEINHHPVANADQAVDLCKQARGPRILLKIWEQLGGMGATRFLSVDNTREK
ncbi:MAG TPA: Do family serine endopeptidase [Verrucomicrobiae bacterium]|nr:Do family serine endopeptidase [Verrucomicrobiae bacterium]